MKEFTKLLSQFLSSSRNLPADLVDRTKLLLLDYLGAPLAGQKSQPPRVLATLVEKQSANNILSAANSAFRYGVAAHALEIDIIEQVKGLEKIRNMNSLSKLLTR